LDLLTADLFGTGGAQGVARHEVAFGHLAITVLPVTAIPDLRTGLAHGVARGRPREERREAALPLSVDLRCALFGVAGREQMIGRGVGGDIDVEVVRVVHPEEARACGVRAQHEAAQRLRLVVAVDADTAAEPRGLRARV